MTLSDLLEEKFRGDIRFRGMAYLKAERVSITRVTVDEVFGMVRDGIEYQTQLTREGGGLKMYCNCAGEFQSEVVCKHLWATILAVDEGGYLAATPKNGYFPPFSAQNGHQNFDQFLDDEDLLNDEFGSELFVRSLSAPKPAASEEPTPEVDRPWEKGLGKLRQDIESKQPKSRAQRQEREIFYEIDISKSKEINKLVIQTTQRQKRVNGQWGKLKPLKLRPELLDEIEHKQDRIILSYLTGGTPERNNWYVQQAETQTLVYRYHMPYELCEQIVPLMCETGRLKILNANSDRWQPLAWDSGPAWQLCLLLDQNSEDEDWKINGFLAREEEQVPISDTELLVPGGLVITKTQVAQIEDYDAFEWVSLFTQAEPFSIPDDEKHEFVDQLLDMPNIPKLELPEELQLEEVECEPQPYLTIQAPSSRRWQSEKLKGKVEFDYLNSMISASSSQWAIVQREQERCVLRNSEKENEFWDQLEECRFRRLIDQRQTGYHVEISVKDLGPAVRTLLNFGWQIKADGKQIREPGKFQFQIKSKIDWFELHANIDFEGRTVAFPELLSALTRGESTINLDDGSIGIIPEEWLEQYEFLSGLGTVHDKHLRFSTNQVALLDALLSSQSNVNYDQKFKNMREKFLSFEGINTGKEPAGFLGKLRDYQLEGLGWLKFLQEFLLGGCLADDMGLGKTVQLLALLLNRGKERKEHKPSLIVVPKSLIFNWRQECEKFTPELKVLEYTGIERSSLLTGLPDYDIVLTTYGTLRRDILQLKDVQFDYIVLDEAQMIKNSRSQVAKASRLLQGTHRVALSGTPIENHLGDLWSIFEFLNPGMLGRSSLFKNSTSDLDNEDTKKLLSSGLRPFILRRTKKEVASELPAKIEQTIFCDMKKEQIRLYEELKDHYRQSLLGLVNKQGLAKSKIHVLEALLRLRQAACHPALVDKTSVDKSSAKLEVLYPHLEELLAEGHKALVFSQFTEMLSLVRKEFDEQKIVYEYLDGQTRNREQCVERFQNDPDCGIFLISLKAGGLGLNLTAADYVFLLDPWWNPAVETQAIDRAHRVGQTKKVIAYRLICRNTVEEKIIKLQEQKKALAESLFTQGPNVLKELTVNDLEMLLS